MVELFIRLSLEHLFRRKEIHLFSLSLSSSLFLIRLLFHTDEIPIHESVELQRVLWMQIAPPGGSLFLSGSSQEREKVNSNGGDTF